MLAGAVNQRSPVPDVWIPKFERNVRDEMEDHVPQVRIYRSWHAPAWRDADTVKLEMYANVLANAKSARLNRRLIDEKIITQDGRQIAILDRLRLEQFE